MGSLKSFLKVFIKGYDQYKKLGGIAHFSIAQVSHGSILAGKKIIVTGGSEGIGLAIARKFLSEGAQVLIVGRNAEKLNRAKNELASDQLYLMQWDVSDFGSLNAKFQESVAQLGGLDLLVNNAAYFPSTLDETDWDKTISTNMKAPYFLCQAAVDYYLEHNQGRCSKILNISSLNSVQSYVHPYFVAKSGVNAITRGFAKKYAERNIVVNGIAPGHCASAVNYQDVSQNAYYRNALNKRIITPEEVAELACFLASDASNGIVGQTIFCDGGTSLL